MVGQLIALLCDNENIFMFTLKEYPPNESNWCSGVIWSDKDVDVCTFPGPFSSVNALWEIRSYPPQTLEWTQIDMTLRWERRRRRRMMVTKYYARLRRINRGVWREVEERSREFSWPVCKQEPGESACTQLWPTYGPAQQGSKSGTASFMLKSSHSNGNKGSEHSHTDCSNVEKSVTDVQCSLWDVPVYGLRLSSLCVTCPFNIIIIISSKYHDVTT